jgi:acetyl esterase/lipase
MNARRRAKVIAGLEAGLDIRDDAVRGRHGDIPLRRYRSRALGAGPALVWVHGGAFSHGGLDQFESHAVSAALARQGIDVVAVDYRRVPAWSWFRDAPPGDLPGVRFPVRLDDVSDAFAAIAARRPGVVLGGASAGACLAAAAALRMVSDGGVAPASLLLAYGTFHAELPAVPAQLRSRLRGPHGLGQFTPTIVRRMNHNYAGNADAMHEPFAFPGGHALAGLPPVLLVDADRDALRASGEAFAGELSAAQVPVEHYVIAGSRHGFLDRPGTTHFSTGIRVLAGRLLGDSEMPPSAGAGASRSRGAAMG